MAVTLDQILRAGRELGASDIHLVRGVAPAFRVHGDISYDTAVSCVRDPTQFRQKTD